MKFKNIFSTAKAKLLFLYGIITIEPMLIFYDFSLILDDVSMHQLQIDKCCLNDFNFTQEVCDNLVEDGYEEQNELVQDEVK